MKTRVVVNFQSRLLDGFWAVSDEKDPRTDDKLLADLRSRLGSEYEVAAESDSLKIIHHGPIKVDRDVEEETRDSILESFFRHDYELEEIQR